MIRLATISFLILFLFGSCKKNKPEMSISYKVTESSVDSPAFSITYTSDKTGASTQATSTADSWNSGGIILEEGQFVNMTVDCHDPLYNFVVTVYKNGGIWKRTNLSNPTGSVTLSGNP
jgi:hypothetical protein